MTIGFYDIDLHHSPKTYPNLELMKIFNYYYQQGHKTVMMEPKSEEGRFNKILYFKNSPSTVIPKNIYVNGENKIIYGYGFYKKINKLKNEILQCKPLYLPYDIQQDKIKKKINHYQKIKRNSLIRFETNDYVDFKQKEQYIYVSDYNPLSFSDSYDYIKEHLKKYQFIFLNTILINDENMFYKYKSIIPYFNQITELNFNYSKDFFLDNYEYDILFIKDAKQNIKNTKIILWYKSKDLVPSIRYYDKIKKDNFILQWGAAATNLSYCEYYKDNKEALDFMNKSSSDLRCLLKTNPKKISKTIFENIDFY